MSTSGNVSRRTLLGGASGLAVLGAFGLSGCAGSGSTASGGAASGSAAAGSAAASTGSSASTGKTLALDSTAWQYDAANDVYWQVGISYAATPAAPDIETLGIFVPGAYLSATDNGNGTFTATVKADGAVAGFTAATAPMVFPVNTPGYRGQQPPTGYSYDQVSSFLAAGLVYVAAGMRGQDTNTDSYTGNAPWGVTDLKAAVRFVRLNADAIPGDSAQVYVFGHSGGGAQSTVMGATGDAPEYVRYLQAIGAAMSDARGNELSDAVAGVMAWCPITSLDYANAAYEWNMGQFASTGTRAPGTWTAAYSANLAAAFGPYINDLRLEDASGAVLTLRKSADGEYLAGTYYDYLLSVITASLNDFLADTAFPYTPAEVSMGGPPGGGAPPAGGAMPSGAMPPGAMPSRGAMPSGAGTSSTTYQTAADYVASLNSDGAWVAYDEATNTATVLSLAGFVTSQKPPSKDVGAFDGVDRQQTENAVLGLGAAGLHFAPVSRDVIAKNEKAYAQLSGWEDGFAADQYSTDFARTDSLGTSVLPRSDSYNPMYYLCRSYDGYRTSTVAPHWRIRTGIMQTDTASTVEVNLALALAMLGVADVDFATVWGQGHTLAERTGDGTANFIAWVSQGGISG